MNKNSIHSGHRFSSSFLVVNGKAGIAFGLFLAVLSGWAQDPASDDFERANLGPDWGVVFPTSGNQVQIIDNSALGMVPGPQGFFLINWRGGSFGPDQFCEAVIPADATPDWAHQPYVRWRENDGARYGFGYDNDPNQVEYYQKWYFKYDGVPSAQTRMMALTDGPAPVPGDTLRVEVIGYTLYGYHNGNLVLTYTDTDPSRIADGEVGLAARWATGNQQTDQDAKVWESWRGGTFIPIYLLLRITKLNEAEVEIRFTTSSGSLYDIEQSSDLQIWDVAEGDVPGTGGEIARSFSTNGSSRMFWYVREK